MHGFPQKGDIWANAMPTCPGPTPVSPHQFEKTAPGDNDIDSDSFATQQTGNSTTNGTSGVITRTTITLTQAEANGVLANDDFRIRVERVTGDGGDTMIGDAQIVGVVVRV